jgi:lipoate---protein ligase
MLNVSPFMHLLDLTLPTPAESLAADEALLDWCEAGHSDELLLFWEPRKTFVVVGYANKVATEVNLPACEAQGVPIHRRCSGGGTVVQMPGGLNYSLILRIIEHGPTRNITAANNFIMEKNRDAIQSALGSDALLVSIRGHTDLALAGIPEAERRSPTRRVNDASSETSRIGDRRSTEIPPESPTTFRKFAGNSQRRRKHFLLFHGTFLLHCDLKRITDLLLMPSLQPDYRASRPHEDFLANLNLPATTIKTALTRAWNATVAPTPLPHAEIQKLAREKYLTRDWNYKF